MKTKIDLNKWNRKEHFLFFTEFDDPFFNLTTKIDCTSTYAFSKENDLSFFICYLYASLKAANETDEFRMRIDGNDVIIHDVIRASPVIMLENNSFRYAYLDYKSTLSEFHKETQQIIDKIKKGVELIPSAGNSDVIHYSVIPWIDFTGLKHPRKFGTKESIPKITFGKLHEESGKQVMPVNIEVNHALMDAFHVSGYLNRMQEIIDNIEECLAD